MIQILGLRPYIDQKTKKEKKKHQLFSTCESVPWLFKNIDKVVGQIPEAERWNVYYTALNCKDHKKGGGGLRRFESQKIIPFDIDGIDVENLDKYIDIFFVVTGLNKEITGGVFSGNGLQFVIEIEEAFDDPTYFEDKRPLYKAICERIDSAIKAAGLNGNADPSVWSPARILRLPNTENRKPTKGTKQARLMHGLIAPQEFDWHKISGLPELQRDTDFIEWNPSKSPNLDKRAILSGCDFFKWILNEPGEIREPHFYASLSIIGHLDNGRALAHKIAESIRDSGSDSSVASFSHGEIEHKIDQATTNSGPRTCSNINNMWGKCKECPHFQKITSPVSIKGEDFIATKDSGFHHWKSGKPYPAYNDLLKYFDQAHFHKTIDQNGLIYVYTGTHYRIFSETEIKAFAQSHFRPSPNSKTISEFTNLVKRTHVIKSDFFTKQTNGHINFENGILDVTKRSLESHGPKFGFRYVLPYKYDSTAIATRFGSFLDEITGGDKQLRSVLEEFGGYSLSGDSYWIHKCLLLVGDGRNGKSKFIEALQLLAGRDNYSNLDIDDLNNENSRQLLEGKAFNICEEISHRSMKDTKHLKAITSGADQKVKLMWHQPYFIQITAKQIFACNTLPPSGDSSYGFLSRMIIVPFKQVFENEKADYFLLDKFKKELPGMFNIFLDGYDRLHKTKKFTAATAVSESVKEYAEDNNIVATWLSETECVEVFPLNGREHFASTEVLYGQFNEWIFGHDAGGRAESISFREFGKLFARAVPEGLERLGRKRVDGPKKRGFYDLRLKKTAQRLNNGQPY